jgi:hypothetical protein
MRELKDTDAVVTTAAELRMLMQDVPDDAEILLAVDNTDPNYDALAFLQVRVPGQEWIEIAVLEANLLFEH